MRLPKADLRRITKALFVLLIALTFCQCLFVVESTAFAQEQTYSQLISDYISFHTPTRIAACADEIAVFDEGEIVIVRGEESIRFSSGAEHCDKLCLSESGVYLLSGVSEDTQPEIRAYTLTGERRDLTIPSEGVTDIALAGNKIYTLSSTTVVCEYDASDGALTATYTLPSMRYSLSFAVDGEKTYFLSVFGSVFSRENGAYSPSTSLGGDVGRIVASLGRLFYEKDGNIRIFDRDTPFLKSGAGDAAFRSITDFAAANGLLFVLDGENQAIKLYDLETGAFVKMIGSYGNDLKRLKDPVTLSAKDGKIVIADSARGSVFTQEGVRALNGRAISDPSDIVIAGDKVYLADGGVLYEYNGGLVKSTEYSIGSGNCRYVTAAPDGTIYASSDKEIYRKKSGEAFFTRFLTVDKVVDGLNIGIGGKILYVFAGGSLCAYSQESMLLGALTVNEPVGSFAVDYRGNAFFLAESGQILKYSRTLEGYAEPVRYALAEEYSHFSDFVLDGQGNAYVIADHNVLIYPKSAFGVFVAADSDFRDDAPAVSPRFICEVNKDYTISYIAPDNFEDITSIPRGTRLMCYATVGYGGDEYLRVETEKGTAYLPKGDVKIYEEGAAPFSRARCLIPAIGEKVVGVNLYEEPSYLAIQAGVTPLFKALGKEAVFDVISYVAADDKGEDVWGFYRVSYEGKTAYVRVEDVVSVDDDPEPMPPRYKARVKSEALGKTVTVYKEADRESEELAHLTDGEEIYALEPVDEKKEFIMVLYEGEVAYVLSQNLGQGGLSGGQILAIVLSVAAIIGSVLTVLILRANKRHKRYQKE